MTVDDALDVIRSGLSGGAIRYICALLLGLVGCDRFGSEDPERAAREQAAERNACIHAELATNSRSTLRQLEQLMGATEAGAGLAAQQYARAYSEYAELRAAATAYVDSAVNHARSRVDSVRYAETAGRFVPNAPDPGTLEANIAQAHAHDFRVIRDSTTHHCNQASR